jgi:hypothetical protein
MMIFWGTFDIRSGAPFDVFTDRPAMTASFLWVDAFSSSSARERLRVRWKIIISPFSPAFALFSWSVSLSEEEEEEDEDEERRERSTSFPLPLFDFEGCGSSSGSLSSPSGAVSPSCSCWT